MEICSPSISQKPSFPKGLKHSPELPWPFQNISSRFPKSFHFRELQPFFALSINFRGKNSFFIVYCCPALNQGLRNELAS